jgi:hypothetical protein
VSVDPLQHEQPNKTPYAYCEDKPVKYIDPDGERLSHTIKQLKLTLNPTLKNILAQIICLNILVSGKHFEGEGKKSGLISDEWKSALFWLILRY